MSLWGGRFGEAPADALWRFTVSHADRRLLAEYHEGLIGLSACLKGEVAEVVVAAIEPFQARFNELLADPAELDRILVEGSAKAGEVAAATLARVREGIGLLPRA